MDVVDVFMGMVIWKKKRLRKLVSNNYFYNIFYLFIIFNIFIVVYFFIIIFIGLCIEFFVKI